jgi:D-sedoheptulose 7-phosphate isomerase
VLKEKRSNNMQWSNYQNQIIESLNTLTISEEILNLIKNSKRNNQKIFIAGNGGSAATAAHFSCDLSLGASRNNYLENFDRYQVIPLTTNMPLILALANDFGYDEIFKQQLINLAQKDDILVAISGSGNSPNIIKAVEFAKTKGIITIGLSGYDGGKLKQLADYNIHVNSHCMEVCEDIHSVISHFIAVYLRESE